MFRLVPRIFLLGVFLGLIPAGISNAAADAVTLNLEAYQGKVVVVDFWASWCVPCRRSFPWMNAMQSKYGDDGLVIVGVNMDADDSEAQSFLDEYPADFNIIYDPAGDLAQDFDVIAMPSSYVFDREGNQVTRHLGFKVKEQNEYEAILVETLKK